MTTAVVRNLWGHVLMTVQASEPGFKIGELVTMGKQRNPAVFRIVNRTPNPVRPDFPWRYDLVKENGDYNRNCVEEPKLKRVKR